MESGQASPRDNVVFEAGLFGGTLGMHSLLRISRDRDGSLELAGRITGVEAYGV